MPRMGDESSISYKDLGKPTVRPVALPYKLFGESAAIACTSPVVLHFGSFLG